MKKSLTLALLLSVPCLLAGCAQLDTSTPQPQQPAAACPVLPLPAGPARPEQSCLAALPGAVVTRLADVTVTSTPQGTLYTLTGKPVTVCHLFGASKALVCDNTFNDRWYAERTPDQRSGWYQKPIEGIVKP